MKIVAPLSHIDHYAPLVEAGADEFYCGFITNEWLRRYGVIQPLNRREYLLDNCNLYTRSAISSLAQLIDRYGAKVKVTLNSLYYQKDQYPLIEDIVKELLEIGINTFIIADPALIVYFRRKGLNIKIHLSGECGTLNRYTIAFFRQFDIERFIFPGKESIESMASCIGFLQQNRQTEFESFALNGWCLFLGAYCNTIHCDELPHSCHLSYRYVRNDTDHTQFSDIYHVMQMQNRLIQQNQSVFKKQYYQLSKHRNDTYSLAENGCGICKIYQLSKIGVTHIKLVGRGNSLMMLKRDVCALKKAIDMILISKSADEYEKRIKHEMFRDKCPSLCYYFN